MCLIFDKINYLNDKSCTHVWKWFLQLFHWHKDNKEKSLQLETKDGYVKNEKKYDNFSKELKGLSKWPIEKQIKMTKYIVWMIKVIHMFENVSFNYFIDKG